MFKNPVHQYVHHLIEIDSCWFKQSDFAWRDERYIVMEYADGGDLAGKIKDSPVDEGHLKAFQGK